METLQKYNIPKIGVYGNHCKENYFLPLGIKPMHLDYFQHKNYLFSGFNGCVKYKESNHQFAQDQASLLMQNILKTDIKNINFEEDNFYIPKGFIEIQDVFLNSHLIGGFRDECIQEFSLLLEIAEIPHQILEEYCFN